MKKEIQTPIVDILLSALKTARDLTRANREQKESVTLSVSLVTEEGTIKEKNEFKTYNYSFDMMDDDGSFIKIKNDFIDEMKKVRKYLDDRYSMLVKVQGLVAILIQ